MGDQIVGSDERPRSLRREVFTLPRYIQVSLHQSCFRFRPVLRSLLLSADSLLEPLPLLLTLAVRGEAGDTVSLAIGAEGGQPRVDPDRLACRLLRLPALPVGDELAVEVTNWP